MPWGAESKRDRTSVARQFRLDGLMFGVWGTLDTLQYKQHRKEPKLLRLLWPLLTVLIVSSGLCVGVG